MDIESEDDDDGGYERPRMPKPGRSVATAPAAFSNPPLLTMGGAKKPPQKKQQAGGGGGKTQQRPPAQVEVRLGPC